MTHIKAINNNNPADFPSRAVQFYDAIIIGAGMCGIATAAGLQAFGVKNFIVLERGNCVGYFWEAHTYDRMHLHTPWHDLPYDNGLVFKYSKYKSSAEMASYLQAYALQFHLNSKIQLHTTVTNITKTKNHNNNHDNDSDNQNDRNNNNRSDDDDSNGRNIGNWIITCVINNTTSILHCKHLCIATSNFRCKFIPLNLKNTMDSFNGQIVHSMDYKNAKRFRGQNALVVGNGNSACEICIDLVENGANKVTLVSRTPRHVIRMKDLESGINGIFGSRYTVIKMLGIWDNFLLSKGFKVTKKHKAYDKVHAVVAPGFASLSLDLSKYNIIKPKASPLEEMFQGNYEVLDVGFVELLQSGRVNAIGGSVKEFFENEIRMENGDVFTDYSVVILCTGFSHGLDQLFDKSLYDEYFGVDPIYERLGVIPLTNGFNQSSMEDNLWFIGFDLGVFGGYARGLWGFYAARKIAKTEKCYARNQELSHWNWVHRTTISVVAALIGGIGYGSYKYILPALKKRWQQQ